MVTDTKREEAPKRTRPAALSSPERYGDRERLLQAAERLAVKTRLTKSFTTNALASCGIMSLGSIHTHFGSREQIIALLLQREASRLAVKPAEGPFFDRMPVIASHAEALLNLIRFDPALFAVLDAEECSGRQLGLPGPRAVFERSLLEAFAHRGAPRWTPPDLIAAQLAGVMLAMGTEVVRHSVPTPIAVRNMQQVSIGMLDGCSWS